MELEQQVAAAAEDQSWSGVIERAAGLLTDHVLSLIALVFLGALVTLATMSVVKRFYPPLPDADIPTANERSRRLQLIATVVGFCWTLFIVTAYTVVTITPAIAVAATVAFGLAIVAAALTPYVYDVLAFGWDWARAWLKRKAGGGDPPPKP